MPYALALDGDRALVTDVSVKQLLAIDLASGDRTVLSGAGVGTGPALVGPYGVLRDTADHAIVMDGGSATILGVDLTTGDRTVVASVGTGTGLGFVGPAVQDGGVLYVLDGSSQGRLLRVTPSTGNREVVADAAGGHGPPMGSGAGLALDTLTGTLVMTSSALGGVVVVDPTSGDRVLLSK